MCLKITKFDSSDNNQRSSFSFESLTTLLRGTGISFFGIVLRKGLSFILQILMGRWLGPAAYGVYTLFVTIIRTASQISMLGMKNAVVHFVAKHQGGNRRELVKGVIIYSIGVALLTSLLISAGFIVFSDSFFLWFFGNSEFSSVITYIAITIPFFVLFTLNQSVLRSWSKIGWMESIRVGRVSFEIIIFSTLFYIGWNLYGAIGAFVCSTFILAGVGLYLIWLHYPGKFLEDPFKINGLKILRYSLPLFFSSVSYALMTRVDIFSIGYLLNSEEVGLYKPAILLSQLVVFPLSALNTAFAPIISDLYNQNKLMELEELYQVGTRWITLASSFIYIFLFCFPEKLLGMWGRSYTDAWLVLLVLGVAQLINSTIGSVGYLLQMSGHQDWALINNLSTLILNIVLNIVLIQKYGVLGAGLATGFSIVVNNLLGLAEVFWILKIIPWSYRFWKLSLPSFFVYIIYWATNDIFSSIWLQGPLFLTVFIVSSLLIVVRNEDLEIMRTVFKQ